MNPGEDRAGSLKGVVRGTIEETDGDDTSIGSVHADELPLIRAGFHGNTRLRR